MKRLIVAQLPHVFKCISYDTTKGLIAKAINVVATFMWNYTDLFLIIISIGLSSLFKQINDSLEENKNKVSKNQVNNHFVLTKKENQHLVQKVIS